MQAPVHYNAHWTFSLIFTFFSCYYAYVSGVRDVIIYKRSNVVVALLFLYAGFSAAVVNNVWPSSLEACQSWADLRPVHTTMFTTVFTGSEHGP